MLVSAFEYSDMIFYCLEIAAAAVELCKIA